MAEKEKEDEKELAVPFYGTTVEVYLGCKISKDRGSRKEDVDVLKGIYNQDNLKKKTGALTKAIEDYQKEDG